MSNESPSSEVIATHTIIEEEEFFTEEESDSFKALSTVGRLRKTFKIFGHTIEIATLTVAEDLQIGLALKKYAESHAFSRAFKLYTSAAAVKSIDGKPLVQTIAPFQATDIESVELKVERLMNYYPVVIDEIFLQLNELEQRLGPVLSRLGKTSG